MEHSIPRHERLQHVRDQRDSIDRLAIGLRVHRRVALQLRLERRGADEGELHALGPGQRPEPQLVGRRAHGDVPR